MSFAWHELHDKLMQSTSTLGVQRDFDGHRRDHPDLSRFGDPAALLDWLHDRTGDPDRKNRALAALVRAAQAPGDDARTAMTLLLLALWPGLDAAHGRLRRRLQGASQDLAGDLVAQVCEGIARADLSRITRVAATLLRNAERDLLRAHIRQARRQKAHAPIGPDDLADEHSGCDAPVFDPERVLDLAGRDATLIRAVVLDGYSQKQAAEMLGIGVEAGRKRYRRALSKLRTALAA